MNQANKPMNIDMVWMAEWVGGVNFKSGELGKSFDGLEK